MGKLSELEYDELLEMERNNSRVEQYFDNGLLKGSIAKLFDTSAEIQWDDGTISVVDLDRLEVAG